ncbi:MAG: hypothetical protein HKM04_05150 [Legionellales bacterium]|nr:hypothetical protein [Legionellales bacterium]
MALGSYQSSNSASYMLQANNFPFNLQQFQENFNLEYQTFLLNQQHRGFFGKFLYSGLQKALARLQEELVELQQFAPEQDVNYADKLWSVKTQVESLANNYELPKHLRTFFRETRQPGALKRTAETMLARFDARAFYKVFNDVCQRYREENSQKQHCAQVPQNTRVQFDKVYLLVKALSVSGSDSVVSREDKANMVAKLREKVTKLMGMEGLPQDFVNFFRNYGAELYLPEAVLKGCNEVFELKELSPSTV